MKALISIISLLLLLSGCKATDVQSVEDEFSQQSIDEAFFSLSDDGGTEGTDIELDDANGVTNIDNDGEDSDVEKFRRHRKIFRRHLRSYIKSQLNIIFDLEDKGFLNISERMTARKALRICRREIRSYWKTSFDVDENGELGEDERAALKTEIISTRLAVKDKFAGDDGEMSEDEAKLLVAEVVDSVLAELVARFDADEDGLITALEVENNTNASNPCTPIIYKLLEE